MSTATPDADAPLVTVTRLTKSYGERRVLDGVSLTVRRSETVALLGPSGGGKSTLLRSMNALSPWEAGEICVGPHTLRASADQGASAATARQVRLLLGMVFQDFQLFPHLSALENVMEAPRRVLAAAPADAKKCAIELLERVGMEAHANSHPHQLSGGQKQRVAIARALAMRPQGLLCDEITSALDPELKHEVLEVLEGLKRDGMTLIVVTHEIGFARRVADRVVVLADGRIVEEGPPEVVLDAPKSERTRQFLRRVMN
jgi:ABC-type polar amino acid transport system ATPase subunit